MSKSKSLDSNEFSSKSRRARYDITPKTGFLGDKGVKIEKTTTYNPSLLFCVVVNP
jgi:hypothetical protein